MNATLSNKTNSISVYVIFLKDLEIFVDVSLSYSVLNSNNSDLEFMNKTVEVCKFLHNGRYEPLLHIIYKIVSEKGRLPQQCPLRKVLQILYL